MDVSDLSFNFEALLLNKLWELKKEKKKFTGHFSQMCIVKSKSLAG